jgi:magnesium transporter
MLEDFVILPAAKTASRNPLQPGCTPMPIQRFVLMPDARQVIRDRDFNTLRSIVKHWRPADLAEMLEELPPSQQAVALRGLPRHQAVAAFQYLRPAGQERLLQALAREEASEMVNALPHDDLTQLLQDLAAAPSKSVLELLEPQKRAVALSLLEFPEDSAGRLMTPDYLAIRPEWTVQQVLDFVREKGRDSETINALYVLDDEGILLDDIRIREFLLAPLAARVSDLMDRRFVALRATDTKEEAVAVFKREDRTVLPVVDSEGRMLGIVTVDDVLDLAEAAATADMQRIGGMEALDEPYMESAFSRMIRKRAGWLVMLFLGEMLTATAMGFFEKEISRAVVLALFIPLIISSGGNSGSQASTLVIRALALGEVGLPDWWRVMRREAFAGLALGAILGGIGFLRITLWSAFTNIYGPHWLLVAVTVGVALLGIVLWGTLAGSLLPFLLRSLGFDPAASSAPFVATLVDVTGLVIYFSVAALILSGTLL